MFDTYIMYSSLFVFKQHLHIFCQLPNVSDIILTPVVVSLKAN